jgi:uncharacterized membrane protein
MTVWKAAAFALGAALGAFGAILYRRTTDLRDTRVALGGARGVHVFEKITIERPADELYRFWRDLTNLPRFMSHLEAVEILSPTRSIWTAKAPAGMRVRWEAQIINEIEGRLIGWRSTANADVATAGSVRFDPVGERATEITVHLQYEPPAGRLGALVASLFGEEPAQQIRDDLRRLKELLDSAPADQPRAEVSREEQGPPVSL